jgi:hypothetical protein
MAEDLQLPLLSSPAPQPVTTVYVPEGSTLCVRFVCTLLGLPSAGVYRLLGDVLGCPRDYRHLRTGDALTGEGIRRLAEHFGREVVVTSSPPEHYRPRRQRGPWWKEHDE